MPNCLTRYGAQPSRCQSVLPVAFSSLYLDIDNHAHHAALAAITKLSDSYEAEFCTIPTL